MKRFKKLDEDYKGAKFKYTTQEINDKLKDYVEVYSNDWENIPIGTHIRYFSITGEFRSGGFVVRHGEKDGEKYVVLQSAYVQNAKTFVVYFHKVKEIWQKKITKEQQSSEDKVQKQLRILDGFLLLKFGNEYKNYVENFF